MANRPHPGPCDQARGPLPTTDARGRPAQEWLCSKCGTVQKTVTIHESKWDEDDDED